MLNHLTLEQKLSITKQFVGIIMEWATPTLPDLTINLKQCSVQPRSFKDPETAAWIFWLLSSRLDPIGVSHGGRLKHTSQIFFENKNTDPLFLGLVSNWQLNTHLSPHFLCNLISTRKIMACSNPEGKFSWAPQRYSHGFTFLHWTQHS